MSHTPGPWKVDRPYIRGAGRAIASLESGSLLKTERLGDSDLVATAADYSQRLQAILPNVDRKSHV